MARRKRVEGWAESPPEGGIYGSIVEVGPETLSVSKEEAAQGWRLVRLVECGPDETVVPKSAAAVVRAAVALSDNLNSSDPRYINGLCRAVERMQKGRKK